MRGSYYSPEDETRLATMQVFFRFYERREPKSVNELFLRRWSYLSFEITKRIIPTIAITTSTIIPARRRKLVTLAKKLDELSL